MTDAMEAAKRIIESAEGKNAIAYDEGGGIDSSFAERVARAYLEAKEQIAHAKAEADDCERHALLANQRAARAEVAVAELVNQMEKAVNISKEHKGYLVYADEPFSAAIARYKKVAP